MADILLAKFPLVLLGLVLTAAFISCEESRPATPTQLTQAALIPIPVRMTESGKAFSIKRDHEIFLSEQSDALSGISAHIAQKWKKHTGYALSPGHAASGGQKGLHLLLSDSLKGEAYQLVINPQTIQLHAGTAEGIFRAWQSLEQLILLQKADSGSEIALPTGRIEDAPRYAYRGTMLDVSRHFFSVDEVKSYIEMIAMYKINYLHLHLADDQGWRIEIKSWPRLTSHGGSKEVGGGKGGFYTQEDYQELVSYAQAHYITIVPEIDMPGHTNAALASYAELNCDGIAPELYTGTDVGFSTLCVNKEITYQFVDDVVREICAITPGPYFHIGGDESHVTKKEDYITFVSKALKIVAKYNKIPIGWDEINQAELAGQTIAQYWNNAENTANALKKGARVIMSPAAYAYLDMKYDSTSTLGLAWASLISVERGYRWDPATLKQEISGEHILGIEAPLWSETITDLAEMSYLAFPRLCGYAEIGWSAAEQRDWAGYRLRLAKHAPLMERMEIHFFRAPEVDWGGSIISPGDVN